MPKRGLLHISGRGTALTLAGHVGIPADLLAGGGLRGVAFLVVTEGGLFRIGGIGTPLALTGDVSIPADLLAGGGLRGVIFRIVGEGGNFTFFFRAAGGAGAFFLACRFAGGGGDGLPFAVDVRFASCGWGGRGRLVTGGEHAQTQKECREKQKQLFHSVVPSLSFYATWAAVSVTFSLRLQSGFGYASSSRSANKITATRAKGEESPGSICE